MSEITIKKAIKYAAKAWDLVRSEVIVNCWRKTEILPPNTNDDTDDNESIDTNYTNPLTGDDDINKIQDFIDKLVPNVYNDPISVKDYLQYEKEEAIHQMMTDKEILEFLEEPEEDIEEEIEISTVSNYEALAALEKVTTYIVQKSEKIQFQKDQIRAIKKLRKVVEQEEFHSKRQVTLDSIITNST